MGFNVFQSLTHGAASAQPLPRVEAFTSLYEAGVIPRRGQLIMVAGRSGSQKSGFALYWTAAMRLDTLYFSADMSPFTAGCRLGSIATGKTSREVEALMGSVQGRRELEQGISKLRVRLCFGSPIKWPDVLAEMNAYVASRNKFPDVVVFDNLMDFDGAESGYEAQMAVMQDVTTFARETGCTVVILHHATDKSLNAHNQPFLPPGRDEIKGGLSEKPELILTVALNPHARELNVACVKQRDGACDLTGKSFVAFRADPERSCFSRLSG